MRPLKSCLVVGASGFVGRVLCEQLQQQGVWVRVMLRREQEGPWNEQIVGDLENSHSLKNIAAELFDGIDTIFYLASIAHSKAPAEKYFQVNVNGCLNFAELALASGVKNFVYVSSTKAMVEPLGRILHEDNEEWPVEAYGVSKRQAEEGLLALNGFEHLSIVRPCLVYGAGVQGNLHTLIKWIDRGVFPPLPDTGAMRSMVSVGDLSSALRKVAVSSLANRKIYILTDGHSYSVKGIENAMRIALGRTVPRWKIPAWFFKYGAACGDVIKKIWNGFPLNSDTLYKLLGPAQYSSQKIQTELGWQPTEDFYRVLPEIIETYNQHKDKQHKNVHS